MEIHVDFKKLIFIEQFIYSQKNEKISKKIDDLKKKKGAQTK